MGEKLKHSFDLMMERIFRECIIVTMVPDGKEKLLNILIEIYHAGCRAQAERDREAVETIPWPTENFTIDQINFCGGIILTALKAAEITGEK